MRWLLRYLLIAASIGTAGFIGYITTKDRFEVPWFVVGWFLACILNAGYLVWDRPPAITPQISRILRLLGLWLDAKESELKARIRSRNTIDD
jgi:hypothetical protein